MYIHIYIHKFHVHLYIYIHIYIYIYMFYLARAISLTSVDHVTLHMPHIIIHRHISFFKLNSELFVCRTIKWYATAHMKFVRESFQGIEESSASFPTQPDIISDVDSYDFQDLLDTLFNLVAGYVSIGSGWHLESVQSRTLTLTSLCPAKREQPIKSKLSAPSC